MRKIHGKIVDTTMVALPGSTVILVSNQRDSLNAIADANGRFTFLKVKGSKLTLTISAIRFEKTRKRYMLNTDGNVADLGDVVLHVAGNTLN